MEKNWFVVHTYSGFEEKVKLTIEEKVEKQHLDERISRILIPTERVIELKGGKKKESDKKFYPGYILVEMELTDDSWYMIKNISGVTGFVGAGARPIPLKTDEIDTILRQAKDAKEKPTPKVMFEKGEAVRVTEGPFMNFNGNIEESNAGKGKIKIMISIFGRATPVELEMWQVEKI